VNRTPRRGSRSAPSRATADAGQLAALLAPLRAEARIEVEDHIDWYRSGRGTRQAPHVDIPTGFDQLCQAAVDLADHIKRVGVESIVSIFFKAALIDRPYVRPDDLAFQARLERMLADLDDFANRLAAARKHVRGPKRGPKTDRAQQFVSLVASVIERHYGRRIERSGKKGSLAELLRKIVTVVDPKIGQGTIDGVLRLQAKRRGVIMS
jgi:hypothetical protein